MEVTVPKNAADAPSSTELDVGETDTESSLVTWTEADALLDGSSTLVACTVIVVDAGRIPGAV